MWRHPLADVAAKAAAPIGAAFTFLALVTGSLWGRPMWGTYWEWDARLTSVLILFLMYLGLIALWRAVEDPSRAARAAAVLTLVGAINLPIIKFSVDWWNTLHQPASVLRAGRPDARPRLPDSAAGDGDRLHAAVPDAASGGDAQRDPAPPRAQPADDAGQPGRQRDAPCRSAPTPPSSSRPIWLVRAVVVMLIGWIALDYRSQTQRLRELEASGVARRSGRSATEL